MTILTRTAKGSPLTRTELDANFVELRDAPAAAVVAERTATATVTNKSISGAANTLTAIPASALASADTQVYDIRNDDLIVRTLLGATTLAQTLDGYSVSGSMFPLGQFAYFSPILVRTAITATGVQWFQQVAGNYTGSTPSKFGLYSYAGGTLTKVAVTADDVNLFKGTAGTVQQRAFTTPYACAAGLYYAAFVWNASAVVTSGDPVIGEVAAAWPTGASGAGLSGSQKLNCAVFLNTADLPATQTLSAASINNERPWIGVY